MDRKGKLATNDPQSLVTWRRACVPRKAHMVALSCKSNQQADWLRSAIQLAEAGYLRDRMLRFLLLPSSCQVATSGLDNSCTFLWELNLETGP